MMVSRSAALALLSVAAGCALAAPTDMPKRKPGLWKIETSVAGMPGGMGPVQQCIDASTDQLYKQMGEGPDNKCAPPDVKRDGDTLKIHSVCKINQTTATTDARFTGKFDSAYRGDIDIAYDPPMQGIPRAKMTLQATWMGACKPGQKPGDIIMANGMTITAEQMKANAERAKSMRQQKPPAATPR